MTQYFFSRYAVALCIHAAPSPSPAHFGTRNRRIVPGLHGQRIRRRHSRPGMGRRFRRSFIFYLREAGIDTADRPTGNRHPQGRPFTAVIFCVLVPAPKSIS